MRSALTGLLALIALALPSDAKAAQQIFCDWEGTMPVAITVEGNAGDVRHDQFYDGDSYYEIEVTRSGVWLLLDEPKRVVGIRLIGPAETIDVAWAPYFEGGRCWR